LLILTSYFSLNIFITLISGYNFFFDLSSRTNHNDSFFNLFNFFWTSFTYLPLFYFLNLLLFFFFYHNILLFFTYLLLLYSFEVCDFIILNLNFDIINLNITDINLLLANNLNKYHPYIFYLSSIFFFIYTFVMLQNYLGIIKLFQIGSLLFNSKKHIFNSLVINTLALFLGSYWAFQEGTWGGWWDWDPSEVFGLLFFITLLLFIHAFFLNLNLFKITVKLILSTVLILLTYFLIQLNFDLVSHNFGTKFFYFFNNNLSLLEFIFIFTFIYILIKAYLIHRLNSVCIIQYNKLNIILNYMINFFISFTYLLLFFLILFSFIPLFNYFLWYGVTTNYYDLVVYFNLIITFFLLLIVGLFRLRKLLDYILIITVITNVQLIPFYFFYFFNWRYSNISFIHIFIATFLVLNLSTHFVDTMFVGLTNKFDSIFYNSIILNNSNTYFNCDNFFIDILNIYTDVNNTLFYDWSNLYLTNLTNNNSVLLLFNNNGFFNFYSISSSLLLSHSFIDLNYLSILYNLFLFISIFILMLYKKQSINQIYY